MFVPWDFRFVYLFDVRLLEVARVQTALFKFRVSKCSFSLDFRFVYFFFRLLEVARFQTALFKFRVSQ